ncbi:MAG: 3-deoxy-D-manno-octulosonic acid transferase [Proteobacteria bacterium]|nr:3-deoxy-D-manno-octulosonic acid transferase [Pseudomonadota bacterium]
MWWRMAIYNIVVVAAFFVAFPWIAWQVLFVKRRREGISQRLGAVPRSDGKVIWCHAVSVGEVRAAVPMLSLIGKEEGAGERLVLSTVTPTGQETARRECGFVKSIFYFPFDLPFVVGRAIRRVDPEIFITAETEIWPNFFAGCFRRKIPVVVVNGRISDHSFSRYRRFRWFFRPILERVSLFLMQSEEDARRIRELGARPETVKVTGNTKYDRVPEPVALPEAVLKWAKTGFLLVAGSTHRGEEEIILEAVGGFDNGKVLAVLVPRHPERFEEVAHLLENRKKAFSRYSRIVRNGEEILGQVILVDAMGVLDGFYGIADAAFVGGSLVPTGGHNLLEPAMHGVPVLTGPSLFNFRDMAKDLVESGKCTVVENESELADALDPLLKQKKGLSGQRPVFEGGSEGEGGASVKNAQAILRLMNPGQVS